MEAQCKTGAVEKSARPVILLFLHGSGDTGPAFRQWLESCSLVERLAPENAINLFPTAPMRPYTPMNGVEANVWFDRPRLSYEETEDPITLAESMNLLNHVLTLAIDAGEVEPIILLIGFSMGGSMALHLAFDRLHRRLPIHGVVVLSSFIGRYSAAIPSQKGNSASSGTFRPQLKMIHGTADEMVPMEWGKRTATRLRANGFDVEFTEVKNLRHELSHTSAKEVYAFVSRTIAKHGDS